MRKIKTVDLHVNADPYKKVRFSLFWDEGKYYFLPQPSISRYERTMRFLFRLQKRFFLSQANVPHLHIGGAIPECEKIGLKVWGAEIFSDKTVANLVCRCGLRITVPNKPMDEEELWRYFKKWNKWNQDSNQ